MGWVSQETGESRIVWHSGIVPDFGAFMALVPEQKKGMVLLFNANHAMMKMTLDDAWPVAHSHPPNRQRHRHTAAFAPLARGSGASPDLWGHVEAAHPAPTDSQPVGGSHSGPHDGQNARLYEALRA
jgi:hypothetical protein